MCAADAKLSMANKPDRHPYPTDKSIGAGKKQRLSFTWSPGLYAVGNTEKIALSDFRIGTRLAVSLGAAVRLPKAKQPNGVSQQHNGPALSRV